MSKWPVEQVPDADTLYFRVHRQWLQKGELALGFFQNRGTGMSGDWSKYSTPDEARDRAKKPGDNGVAALCVADIRTVPGQDVVHDPLDENRAHSEVRGEKELEHRVHLRRVATIVLQPGAGEP